MCALCKESFASAWDLMVHAQAAHMVNIYQLGSKDAGQVRILREAWFCRTCATTHIAATFYALLLLQGSHHMIIEYCVQCINAIHDSVHANDSIYHPC